jgi:hypothetical protein
MGCLIDNVKLICEFWQMLFVNAPKFLNQVNCVDGELNIKNVNKDEVLSGRAINSYKTRSSYYSQPRNYSGKFFAWPLYTNTKSPPTSME